MSESDDMPPWSIPLANAVIEEILELGAKTDWENNFYKDKQNWTAVARTILAAALFCERDNCRSMQDAELLVIKALDAPLPITDIVAAQQLLEWQQRKARQCQTSPSGI